jgi:peptide/nickel transport system ATP-binding protein
MKVKQMESVLEIKNLNIHFDSRDGKVNAVSKANLKIGKGQILGLIGETGSGKSVLGQSILRLLPANANVSGEILFEGTDILSMSRNDIRKIRGQKIAFICQNPSEALNPVLKNGTQIMESVRLNRRIPAAECRKISIELLRSMKFHNPGQCMKHYPLHLSGGMKQRFLAAMGMSGTPSLLIMDEPTKGLDALVRGQVIATIRKFIGKTGCSAIIITHDLKFAFSICSSIAVMYAGEIIEKGEVDEIMNAPRHPYLLALIDSQPHKGLHVLKGNACSLIDPPDYCRFYDRCKKASDECRAIHPDAANVGEGHEVRCINLD